MRMCSELRVFAALRRMVNPHEGRSSLFQYLLHYISFCKWGGNVAYRTYGPADIDKSPFPLGNKIFFNARSDGKEV
jgi:hypothetical protein